MKAYCIFDVREVLDPRKLDDYSSQVLETVRAYGGRYLGVGGDCVVVEGDWAPRFPVLIEFPDPAAARGWYASEAYARIRPLRLAGAKTDGVIVEPVAGDLRARLAVDA